MASPETIPTNTQEEAEREAPDFESGEQPISPEEQVEQAMKAVETAKKEFDPTKADAGMARDQNEYAERLSASPESIAEADEVIAGELSAIRTEEAGLLAKLNAKLRKYVGVAGLFAATGGTVHSMETQDNVFPDKAVGARMFTDVSHRQNVTASEEGAKSENVGEGSDLNEAFFREVNRKSISDSDIPNVQEVTGNEPEHVVRQREADGYVKQMQERFEQTEFRDEHEIIDFLRGIAESAPFEFYAAYGLDDFGHLKKFSGGFGSGTSIESAELPKILKDAKTKGITKLIFAHTHPNQAIGSLEVRNAFSSDEQQKLSHRGRIDMPPSGADIRTAGELDWLDYYDDPVKSESHGGVETHGVVVTSEATWKFRANFFHPAMERQRAEAIRFIEGDPDFQIWKSKHGISDSEAYDILHAVQIPDNLVRARVLLSPKYREAFRGFDFYSFIMHARIGTELNKDASQFAWVEEQKKVVLASPEEKSAAVEKFIAFCKENGVDMQYVPFDRKE